jgi:topoisomerase-4 subunit A
VIAIWTPPGARAINRWSFLDATGRTYSLSAHTLPSARGYGEPLTGRFVLPPGATFTDVIMAPAHQQLLMASDAGYGFITRFEDLVTRNTKGKAIAYAAQRRPAAAAHPAGNVPPNHLLAAVTSEGRMLVFPLDKLPAISQGQRQQDYSDPTQAGQGTHGTADAFVPDPGRRDPDHSRRQTVFSS